MAYNVNGKIFTDNSLMDEIVHNCKLILQGIVVKNDVLANNSETENSLTFAEVYEIQREDGTVPFSVFPFTREILEAYGAFTESEITAYLRDSNNIPEEYRDGLTAFANQWFRENYEEENDYYRMLNGLPPYNSGEDYYIYLDDTYIPSKYNKNVDYTIPLHLQPLDIINLLYNTGGMDRLKTEYPTSKYSYIGYLGPRKIDLYIARKANKWDILYMPNVYYLVEDKFTEFYRINRDIYLNQSYQEVYADTSEYYDQLMIVTLLAQTFADMVTDVPEWYIRRDIFDIRSVKYFLESYGVTFFKEIPLKYQIAIVKNINKLIKFKSSTMNMEDIAKIFVNDNIRILKYWLYKRRLIEDGKFTEGDSEEDLYKLEFISSAIDESYDAYIKDYNYRTPYDDITYQDKYWDGQDTHSYIRNKILSEDFTIQGTKYMSIEYKVSMSEYNFQVEYFLGLLLDSKVNTDDILISVPSIDENCQFPISDLFILTILLSDSYYRESFEDRTFDIRRPSDTSTGSKPTIDENHYDWRVKTIPEIFQVKNGRVHAFNPEFDLEGMKEFLTRRRHSHYIFGASYKNVDFDNPGEDTPLTNDEYYNRAFPSLNELDITNFIVPAATYDNIDDLINVYRTNKKCYDNLIQKIRETDDEDELSTLAYIYQEMYTRKFDEDFYKLSTDKTDANSLVDILLDRNYILYEYYRKIMQEKNIDTRQDQIRLILNDIVETLEYYISGEGLEYLFAFTPINSFYNVVYYIWLMINFFKSYKVQFLDPFSTMVVDISTDPLDVTMWSMDKINEWKVTNGRRDKQFTIDQISKEIQEDFYDEAKFQIEGLDYYAYQDKDPLEDMDYDGLNAEKGEDDGYKDLDGGIADDAHNTPYIDIDAGKSYLGMRNINDLDGGGADEAYNEYLEVDGGGAYHSDDERTDWYGTQGFNYDIDGGASNPEYFKSRSIEINVKGNAITLDVVPSNREGNPVTILEDGVYVADFMTEQVDFDAMVDDIEAIHEIIDTYNAEELAELSQLDSFYDIQLRIQKVIQEILYNMKTSYDDLYNGKLLERYSAFVDSSADYVKNRYQNSNPYGWVEL